ncbi:MAG: sigma 54-interacting transcriptional regulator [Desulfomonile tiedjei]|nr:sigma 54-interacting transcriptional regulator [Desulfomonile tiedjei]
MPLKFDSDQCYLWPAAAILRRGRERAPFQTIMEMARGYLRLCRFGSGQKSALAALGSSAAPTDVANWLDSVWQRFQTARRPALVETRRTLRDEIVHSGLALEEQATLATAVDYLFRLASARIVATVSGSSNTGEVPATFSPAMQETYLRLAELAATDLPIWLTGETGTGPEPMARLVHRLRGLPAHTFRSYDQAGLRDAEPDIHELGPDTTLFVPRIDDAPERFQKWLREQLILQMRQTALGGLVLSSAPVDPYEKRIGGIAAELFAFLRPFRVHLPPLRSRIEDLDALVGFWARSRGLEANLLERFTAEALNILRTHHWPGNVDELETTLSFVLGKRPAGRIRPEDLPETIRPYGTLDPDLIGALERIADAERIRALSAPEGRRRLALFLAEHRGSRFGAGEVQRFVGLGRDTAARLLRALQFFGIIKGITGAGGKRVTRWVLTPREKDRAL